jgi:hypothetical protein
VSPPSNTAAILKHLSASSGGLSVHQLRDALGGNSSIAELSDELSILSRQGLVHLVKGHLWRPRGMYPADVIGTQLMKTEVHPSEWSDVRRLCRYYRDCNLLSGSKGMTLWPDREQRYFVQMTARVDWSVLITGGDRQAATAGYRQSRLQTAGTDAKRVDGPASSSNRLPLA